MLDGWAGKVRRRRRSGMKLGGGMIIMIISGMDYYCCYDGYLMDTIPS